MEAVFQAESRRIFSDDFQPSSYSVPVESGQKSPEKIRQDSAWNTASIFPRSSEISYRIR